MMKSGETQGKGWCAAVEGNEAVGCCSAHQAGETAAATAGEIEVWDRLPHNNRTDIQDMNNKMIDLDKYYCRWNTDRTPCWCDRILTANYPGINRIVYTSDDHSLINESDHLPIFSLFNIDNNLINEKVD